MTAAMREKLTCRDECSVPYGSNYRPLVVSVVAAHYGLLPFSRSVVVLGPP
jgi:hypothetical protein